MFSHRVRLICKALGLSPRCSEYLFGVAKWIPKPDFFPWHPWFRLLFNSITRLPPRFPGLPDTIPPSWLRVRIIPNDLISTAELHSRYKEWLAVRKVLDAASRQSEPDPDGARLPPEIHFDSTTGRYTFTPPSEPDPVDDLLADIHEFTQFNGPLPLDRWRSGDELWRFSSESESWQGLAGRAGFVWLRKGRPLRAYCTILS